MAKTLTEQQVFDDDKAWNLWFQGTEREISEAIVHFIKSCGNNRHGVTFAQLENFFVYKKNICTQRALCNHLASLEKFKMISFEMCRGLKFYKVKQ